MVNLPSNLPNIEIVQDGRQVVRPDVMSLVTQLAQLAQLNRMRRLEESKVPVKDKPLKFTVPDTTMKVVLGQPWISFSLLNDGAGAVTVWVNDEDDPLVESMILSGETYAPSMTYPIINTIYLKAASGTTAAVRVFGKEGRHI